MIRKLIAGLAIVGTLAVGSATVVSAETSSGTNPSALSAQQQQQGHDRRCARANKLLNVLEKWQTQLDSRIAKLQAKQGQITDPDKAAKAAELITRLQHRSSELKEYTDKLASGIGDKCPAPAPAAATTTTA